MKLKSSTSVEILRKDTIYGNRRRGIIVACRFPQNEEFQRGAIKTVDSQNITSKLTNFLIG